ncbi:MAG: BrnT family toxin [Acidobacteriota bacterium]|nr:BrnT family toxin [Acidobacteriota bacterium]
MRFDWNSNKAAANLKNHKVSFAEAAEAFADPNLVDDYDVGHSDEEPRYRIIGLSSRRLLFVTYTERDEGEVIWIIHARKAGPQHRREYEQN